MKKDRLISFLQKSLGASKNEIIFASVLVVGLILSLAVQFFTQEDRQLETGKKLEQIYHSIDSVTKVKNTMNTGTDIHNNAFPELVKADTIVRIDEDTGNPRKVSTGSSKIDINSASRIELMSLPGIGEAMAIRIIEFREKNKFARSEDIMNVKGIGEKKFEKMKEFIEVK